LAAAADIGIRDAGKTRKASGTRTVFILKQWERAFMLGFRMPLQFLLFGVRCIALDCTLEAYLQGLIAIRR
jgi:hypothetical protein